MQIETKRLLLRPWEESDAIELYRYAKDPAIGPITGWPPHTSVEDSLNIIRTVLSKEGNFSVVLKETGKPVGSAGIILNEQGSANLKYGEAEIGYWIGVPYWGRGLIPEAVRALLAHCFTALDCHTVWCGYYDGNIKSKRVQEKCGFLYQFSEERTTLMGDTRLEHFTKITKAEWEAALDFRPGRYRHFKGGEYELISLATHSETREELVVYRALYGEYGVWVRPKAMWNEMVEQNGCLVKRFCYIEDEVLDGTSVKKP